MPRPDILLVSPVSDALLDRLGYFYEVHLGYTSAQREQSVREAGDRIAAIVGHHPITDALLDTCLAAKLICTFAAGYDNVDLDRARGEGRIVCNMPGATAGEVADSAIMLVLAGMKRLRDLDALVREGRWPDEGAPPFRKGLEGTPVGVAGVGPVGQAILSRLGAFGAELHYHARRKRSLEARYHETLVGLSNTCDVLILALPGGRETRHAAANEVFRALGPDGLLVNIGRGTVVDEAALISALSNGTLGFAALDVFEDEPHVPAALRSLPNTLFTPHYAGAGAQVQQRKADMLLATLAAYFRGAPVPYRIV